MLEMDHDETNSTATATDSPAAVAAEVEPIRNSLLRPYLDQFGAVPLLSREGEVAVCKRMTEGRRRVLQSVLGCPPAIAELLNLGEELRSEQIRVHEVVSDRDVDEAAGCDDEVLSIKRVVAALEAAAVHAQTFTQKLQQRRARPLGTAVLSPLLDAQVARTPSRTV